MERSKSTSRCLISQLCLNQKNRYYYSSKPTGTMLYHVSTIFKASIELLNKINEIVSTSVRSMEHPYESNSTDVLNQANVLKAQVPQAIWEIKPCDL